MAKGNGFIGNKTMTWRKKIPLKVANQGDLLRQSELVSPAIS